MVETVRVDFNVNDTWRSLTTLLARLRASDGSKLHEDIQLDLRPSQYLGPIAVAVLVAAVRVAERRGAKVSVDLPNTPPALRAYCHYSGLEQALCGGAPPDVDAPKNETVPILESPQTSFWMRDGSLRLISRHIEVTADSEDYLRVCIMEVQQNVTGQAASPIGSMAAARFFSATKDVRVAIVDRGVGISESLRARHGYIDDATAME